MKKREKLTFQNELNAKTGLPLFKEIQSSLKLEKKKTQFFLSSAFL